MRWYWFDGKDVVAAAGTGGEVTVKLSIVAGTLVTLTLARPAAAEPQGDPAAGHELASQFCSSCHIVGNERVGSDVAPPFRTIAKDPAMKLTKLHAWRGPMHPILTNLALTAQQIADINAYLDSLRASDEPAGAPPTPTKKPPAAIRNAPPEKLGEPIQPKPK
jgi:mono/diheme cytochrome c family protein